jgi:Sulfotransferase domain
MNIHPLKNWIPFRLDFQEKDPHCRWLYVADKKYNEPFFHETTAKCKVFEENRKPFHAVSTLDGIIDFAENMPSIEPTAFIFHVSRCGSTLLAQLLSLDETNTVLAEPPIFDEVLREITFKNSDISEEKIDKTLKAVVKFLGQKRTGDEQNFFIKLDSWHIFYYEKLRKLYPKTPFIFSFRRPDEVIRSQVQESGMHAAPGVIQPELLGFTLEEILPLERPVYVAKVLEKYFEHYLEIITKDTNTLFINYAEGILTSLDRIQQFLKLKIEPSVKQKMVERTQFHSKRPNTVFTEKPLEDKLPDYQKKVFEMYEKLAKK